MRRKGSSTDGERVSDGRRLKPRLGGRVRGEAPIRFRNAILSFANQLKGAAGAASGRPLRGGARDRGARAAYVRPAAALSRRVVIKGHYHAMGAYGAKAAKLHLDYIQRDGAGEDGAPGELYGRTGPVLASEFERPLPGEPRQFRFIVAPEDGAEIDLTAFTRRLMAQVESDLGRRLHWVASNHHNTDNPHAHLVIRGVDESGVELRIDREYIANGMRNRAREIATEELGLRTERQVDLQLEREVRQQRLTSIDREIGARLDGHAIDLANMHREPRIRARLVGRVIALQEMGLARPAGGARWILQSGWDGTLRRLGEQDDIIKRIHRTVQLETSRYSRFPEPETSGVQTVEGIIRAKGLHDELRGDMYLVIEAPDGRAVYAALPAGKAADRRIGEIVRLVDRPVARRLDEALAAMAARGAGRISASDLTGPGRPPGVSARDLRWRLQLLEKASLATRNPDETYHLVDNWAERAAKDPRTAGQRRLDATTFGPFKPDEQPGYRGPTWLDTVSLDSCKATHGFGAQVADALAARRGVLQALGMDPADPKSTLPRLRALERYDFAARLANTTAERNVARPDGRFSGHLEVQKTPLPSGQLITVVRNRKTKEFVVLRRAPEHQAYDGKVVELTTDGRGRPQPRLVSRGITD